MSGYSFCPSAFLRMDSARAFVLDISQTAPVG
ncbi:hypothetical protein ECEC96038_5826, partial [Escherichia coli EC96038]